MTKRILITGASGFIGHHIVEHILKNTDWEIVTIDRLSKTTSHGFDRLRDIKAFDDKRVTRFTADLNMPIGEGLKKEIGININYILHLAAGSHVDNSIKNPIPFVLNNIQSTLNMLEYGKELMTEEAGDLERFIYFSTDEVYGTAPKGYNYEEGDRFNPGNPYSASKASSECLCMAYANTYKLPIVITNTMNVLGERQHPEKFFPKIMNYILDGKTLPIHSNKDKTKAGTRFYIHARNVADAILFILQKTTETLDNVNASTGKYHIVGEKELDNLELAQLVANKMGKELKYEMVDFHSSRPGHDLRYALDGTKMEELGWKLPHTIEESIGNIVDWSLQPENQRWLDR